MEYYEYIEKLYDYKTGKARRIVNYPNNFEVSLLKTHTQNLEFDIVSFF